MGVPDLSQFRVELQANGLAHLVFDCPGRTMNVFSNAAIHELALVAAWLADSDVKGLLIRSGKDNAFCAGADLNELGVAYDMIMQAAPRDRFNVAFDHFFPLSKAIRALETAGKPVAAAIAGLALGGGCELALGAHYRVLVDDPKVGMPRCRSCWMARGCRDKRRWMRGWCTSWRRLARRSRERRRGCCPALWHLNLGTSTLRAKRGNPEPIRQRLDCRVATLLAMTRC
jgi:Enoyl-CoA hydratase/isomerase